MFLQNKQKQTSLTRQWRSADFALSEFFDLPPSHEIAEERQRLDRFFAESDLEMFRNREDKITLNPGEVFEGISAISDDK